MPSMFVTRCRMARSNGFTLMEVLVAVVIVALSITVFFQLLSASMNLERRSRDRIEMLLIADQVFGELQRLDLREADFPWSGETESLSWRLEVHPVEIVEQKTDQAEAPLRLPLELFKYVFRYEWDGKPAGAITRYAVHTPDFFDDQFRARSFAVSQR